MPSKSSCDSSLHKFKGFHLKYKKNTNKQANTTSSGVLKESAPAAASSSKSVSSEGIPVQIQYPRFALKSRNESKPGTVTRISKCGDISRGVANYPLNHLVNCEGKNSLCTRPLKKKNLLSGKNNLVSEPTVISPRLNQTDKYFAGSKGKIVSLHNLTIQAIKYKCKLLQFHNKKCSCATPRLHIYLSTNHRCYDECSIKSFHKIDCNPKDSSSTSASRNKFIFMTMTGKSKARSHLHKSTAENKLKKTSKKKSADESLNNVVSECVSSRGKRKVSAKRDSEDEPESELLGEECESLPTIMNTLSGDVEYIVLDDDTFNLSKNAKNDVSNGAVKSYADSIFDDVDIKPDIDSLPKVSEFSKESKNWENILERCLSEVSYQPNKNKSLQQTLDNTKIKCEQVEGGSTTGAETSSLAGVCTNLCPSIKDIFGDISIKDEPLDTMDTNDMSVEDFSQEIMKLSKSEQHSGNRSKWSVSQDKSLNDEINKGLFAGLIKVENTADGDMKDSKLGSPLHAKVSADDATNDSMKETDDYSSDDSLGPLQIDEGEPLPPENEVPVQNTPVMQEATSILIPSVNIISPFKIKILFSSPKRMHLEKQKEFVAPARNTASAGETSTALQKGDGPKPANTQIQKLIDDDDSLNDSLQTLLLQESNVTPSLTCIYCNTVSPDIKALAKHFEDHQKEGLIICYFCQKSFGDKTGMKRHMRSHTGEKPYQCKVCGKRFSLPGNFKKHRDIHEDIRTEPCEVCGKTFRRKEHLKYHMRTHTGEKPYTCKECGTSFTARYSLQIHMNIHLGKKPYKCTYCSKAFSDKSTMRKHIRVHTGEKPFNCDVCGRCFGESGTLAAHMATHRSDRPFKCKQCPLSFKTPGGLRQHDKIHTGDKQYACRFCGVKFLQKYNMTQHERIHTGEKPYACEYCDRSFRSRSCLAKHVVLHGGEEERRYECEHCNSRFYRKAHLRRHIDMHLGIKKYECGICSKKFCTRATLENHRKTFHSQGARRFPCHWCGRIFKRQVYVNTHECIRDPVKVEKYKQEMRAAALAKNAEVTSARDENSSETECSSIDIKSEPEDDAQEQDGLGEIHSVIGNATFESQETLIKQDPS